MKRLFIISILTASGAFADSESAVTDAEVRSRASALEVAGAFSNNGFKIRDGHWQGTLAPNAPKVIQVTLYAGNQYWFIAAAPEGAKRLTVSVFDETGKPVGTEPYENKAQAAAGFSPAASGPYYVRIEETEGAASTFCLIYSYK